MTRRVSGSKKPYIVISPILKKVKERQRTSAGHFEMSYCLYIIFHKFLLTMMMLSLRSLPRQVTFVTESRFPRRFPAMVCSKTCPGFAAKLHVHMIPGYSEMRAINR